MFRKRKGFSFLSTAERCGNGRCSEADDGSSSVYGGGNSVIRGRRDCGGTTLLRVVDERAIFLMPVHKRAASSARISFVSNIGLFHSMDLTEEQGTSVF